MDLFPAIDLRGGRVVRLHQGDFAQETVYGDDPAAVAVSFADAGATWIHVVDLDAALTGEPRNRHLVSAMAEAVGSRARLQVGGGARDRDSALALLAAGARRVVIGTAAVEDPALVRELAAENAVAVGVDTRDGEVMVRGWTSGSGRRLCDVMRDLEDAGAEAVIVTDIGRDATMAGPSLDVLAEAMGCTGVEVIASGGVGTLDDIVALGRLRSGQRGLAGAIVGKAIHDGRFGVKEAIAACAVSE